MLCYFTSHDRYLREFISRSTVQVTVLSKEKKKMKSQNTLYKALVQNFHCLLTDTEAAESSHKIELLSTFFKNDCVYREVHLGAQNCNKVQNVLFCGEYQFCHFCNVDYKLAGAGPGFQSLYGGQVCSFYTRVCFC